jgi:hypothetical protein
VENKLIIVRVVRRWSGATEIWLGLKTRSLQFWFFLSFINVNELCSITYLIETAFPL